MKSPNLAPLRHLTAQARAAVYRVRHDRPPTHLSLRRVRHCLPVLLFILIAAAVYSTSSAASIDNSAQGNPNNGENFFLAAMQRAFALKLEPTSLLTPPAPLQPQTGPPPTATLAFYAQDCMTPKQLFNLGDTVCVQVSNVDPNLNAHVDWVGASGFVQASSAWITTGSLTTSFTIPTDANVGRWRANITSISDGAARATAFFTVRDPNSANADLSVNKTVKRATAAAGSDMEFEIDVVNNGPDPATNVTLTDVLANDTTFVALRQDTGSSFNCTTPAIGATGQSTCTIASLANGETASFTAIYKVNPSTAADTLLSATARIAATAPADRFALNDSSTDSAPVHIEPCVVTCPANITGVSSAQDMFGAYVSLSGASGSSSACGDLSYSPDSGSFFPVGTTVVQVSGVTGSACSFTVEVKDTQAPTLDCPDDYTTFESAAGSGSALVNYGAPLATDNDPSFGSSNVSCSPASGTTFNVGTTPVTCTATDPSGNTNSCSFNVTVQPLASCTLTCPQSIVQDSDADGCGTHVTYGAEASNECGAITYTNGKTGVPLPSGSFFPVGTTVVKATSATGDNCFFKVTVRDTTPPSFNQPAPIVVSAGATSCEARVTVPTPSVTDNCTGATISGVRDDGHLLTDAYPVGTTTITWTAKDRAGLTTSHDQTVTVRDTVAPVVNLVPDKTEIVPADSCQVEVPEVIQVAIGGSTDTSPLGTASDNCKPLRLLTIVQSPAAGTLVGPGDYPITVTVYDGDPEDTTNPPNHTTKTMLFKVRDNTPPTIVAPASVTVGTGPNATMCGAVVSDAQLGAPTTTDNCAVNITRTGVPAGNVFPKGTTTITWKVTDVGGNEATANQTVTVVDDTPPVISCQSNIVVTLPANTTDTSMAVTYQAPVGTDNCGATTAQTAGLPSGAQFPVGTTTNTFTATDAAGNTASCSFTVTVLYNFTGFFQPVGNLPTLNVVNAGRAIPVKFSLSGNKGLSIFAASSPSSVSINCNSTDPNVDVTETVTAGGSTLGYSPDQYSYVWKTDSAWAGTCRQLIIQLNDGSYHRANFRFK